MNRIGYDLHRPPVLGVEDENGYLRSGVRMFHDLTRLITTPQRDKEWGLRTSNILR